MQQRPAWLILLVCALAVIIEGVELQTFGIAAAGIGEAFSLTRADLGFAGSASLVGLLLGSLFGGRLADRFGRKAILLLSIAEFTLCTFATIFVTNFDHLLVLRFLTGLGLGATLPNLIAIAADNGAPEQRTRRVTMMMAGLPLGALSLGAIATGEWAADWRAIFLVCGIAGAALLPLLWLGVPRDVHVVRAATTDASVAPPSLVATLFGRDTRYGTLLLWVTIYVIQTTISLLSNWLPILIQDAGFTRAQGAIAISALNVGGVVATLVTGWLITRSARWIVPTFTYAGIAASIVLLAQPWTDFNTTVAIIALTGGFVICGSMMVYALASDVYPTLVRATGVGVGIAVGRLGAITGPLLGGALLNIGVSTSNLLLTLLPLVLLAGVAINALSRRAPVA